MFYINKLQLKRSGVPAHCISTSQLYGLSSSTARRFGTLLLPALAAHKLNSLNHRRNHVWKDGGGPIPLSPPSPPPFPSLPVLPAPLPISSPYPHSLPPPLSSPPFPFPLPSLRSRPRQIQLGGLGERCKLPQRGLGRSPSRNRIWCIFALKDDIWWQQF